MCSAHWEFILAVKHADKTFNEDWKVFAHRFRMAWMYLACQIDSNWSELPDIFMVTSGLLGSPEDLNAGPYRDALQGVYDAWRALCKAKKQANAPEAASCA